MNRSRKVRSAEFNDDGEAAPPSLRQEAAPGSVASICCLSLHASTQGATGRRDADITVSEGYSAKIQNRSG